MSKKLINKQSKKHAEGECRFCGENDYTVLDCHRIHEGADGGRYEDENVVVTCANCHRKIHDGQIVIDRYYSSTNGRVLHYWIGDQEFFE